MNTATLTLIALFASGVTLATVFVYERLVADLRERIARQDEHISQCEFLLASMVRHPAGQVTPDLRLLRGGEGA